MKIADKLLWGAVTAAGSGDTIVLAGSVKSADDSKRLAGMAQTRAKTVINLLKAPPPPDPRQILLQVKFAAVDRVELTQVGFNLFSLNDKMIGGTGLSLDQAMMRVSEEMAYIYPELANEFATVVMQVRAGQWRHSIRVYAGRLTPPSAIPHNGFDGLSEIEADVTRRRT